MIESYLARPRDAMNLASTRVFSTPGMCTLTSNSSWGPSCIPLCSLHTRSRVVALHDVVWERLKVVDRSERRGWYSTNLTKLRDPEGREGGHTRSMRRSWYPVCEIDGWVEVSGFHFGIGRSAYCVAPIVGASLGVHDSSGQLRSRPYRTATAEGKNYPTTSTEGSRICSYLRWWTFSHLCSISRSPPALRPSPATYSQEFSHCGQTGP